MYFFAFTQSEFDLNINNNSDSPASIPYVCNFEDSTENAQWQLSNATCTNLWIIEAPTNVQPPLSGNRLFISSDNGVTNTYSVSSPGTVVASRTVQSTGANAYNLKFDLYIGGESVNDYLKVFIVDVDTNYVGVAGTNFPYYSDTLYGNNQLLVNSNYSHRFINGYNGTSTMSGYYPMEIQIPGLGFNGEIKKIVFVWKNNSNNGVQPPAAIDNISLDIATCLVPSNITVSNTQAHSVSCSWIENGYSTNWVVYYKKENQNTWDSLLTTSNPVTISGLTPSTKYNIKLRSVCGGNTSIFTNTITFKTLCGNYTQFPYFEGFDVSWNSTPLLPGNTVSPDCWININGGVQSDYWTSTFFGGTFHSGTGAAQHTLNSQVSANDYLISPVITLTGNERLKFWLKGSIIYPNFLEVGLFNITQNGYDIQSMNDTSLISTLISNIIPNENIWTQYTLYLNDFIGDFRIAFIRNLVGGYALNLDDIIVESIPSCSPPISTTEMLGSTYAQISWNTLNSIQNGYILKYKLSTASVYDSVFVTGTSYTINNLLENSTYQYTLSTICNSDTSQSTEIKSFTTWCDPIMNIPYIENFDIYGIGSSTYPLCWRKISTYPIGPIIQSVNYSSPGSLYFNINTQNGYSLAILPLLDTSIHLNNIKVEFKMKASDFNDILLLGVMSDPTNINTFQQIASFTVSSDGFENKIVSLANFQLSGQFLAFKTIYTSNNTLIYVDNLEIDTLSFCSEPNNLNVTQIYDSHVLLSWFENGTSNIWNVEYGPIGFIQGTGISINGVTTNPMMLSNLFPSTTYQFYVQSICNGSLSPWSNPYTFTTACPPIVNLPWSDSFDSLTSGIGILPTCWTKISSTTSYPTLATYCFSIPNSLAFNNNSLNSFNIALTPRFDYNIPIDTMKVSFKYRRSGSDDTLYVGVMTDVDDMNSFELVSKIYDNSSSWIDKEVYFGSYIGVGDFIAFKTNYTTTSTSIYIDNVIVDYMPPCPKPTNLTVTGVSSNSIDLSWSENGSATSWNIEFGPLGFSQGTGTLISGIDTTSYSFGNLISHATYQFYIQSNCDSLNQSNWNSINCTTLCGEINVLPWIDYFDNYGSGTSVFPTCWTKISNVLNKPNVNSTFFSSPSGLSFLCNNNGTYNYAVTPIVNPSIPINSLIATFKFRTSYLTDSLYVGVMSDPNDTATFVKIATLANPQTTQWFDKAVNFSSYLGNGHYIAFKIKHQGSSASNVNIDNLKIELLPVCPNPSDVYTSNITSTSIQLSWNEVGNTNTWNIEYGPVGYTSETATTIYGVVSNPFTISGLYPQTPYQFKVQSHCGSQYSDWSSAPITSTSCGSIVHLPWNDSFDYYGVGSNISPSCWSTIVYSTNTPSISSVNNTPPGSINLQCFNIGSFAYIISPQIDLSIPINSLLVEFNLRAYTTADTLYVGVMSSNTDSSTFVLIDKLAVSFYNTFENRVVDFSSYSGIGQYIAFKINKGVYSTSVFIDDFVLKPIPTCITPIHLGVENVSLTSAKLFWTENGLSSSWNLEYGPQGFLSGTGNMITNIIDTFLVINNLIPGTTYQFRVQAYCGFNDLSLFSNRYTFSTDCLPIETLPWTENFDSYGIGTTLFPICFQKLSTNQSFPYLSSNSFSAPTSICLRNDSIGTPQCLILPQFDTNYSINSLKLSFKMRVGNSNDTLYVGVISNVDQLESFDIYKKITLNSINSWTNKDVYFNNYFGNGTHLAFKTVTTSSSSNLYIDDLSIDLIPDCPTPSDLFFTNLNHNSFDLGFTENGNATSWNIEYGPVGFSLGSGIQILNVNTNPININGLTPNTTYQFYIKSNCGLNEESQWSNPIQITTLCAPITSLPWSDNFDTYGIGSTVFPSCWKRLSTVTNLPSINGLNFSSPGSMVFNCNIAGSYNIALPPMIDSSIQINSLGITFKLRTVYLTDTLEVGVISDPNDPSTFELIEKVFNSSIGVWQTKDIYLNNYYGDGHFIAFKLQRSNSLTTCYIDNLEINIPPTCIKPNQINSTNITSFTADLFWNENNSATSWRIEYGPIGFLHGSGTIITADSIPFTLSNLNPATCYDFYIRSVCDTNDQSEWSEKSTFCTYQLSLTIPASIDFESEIGFQFANNVSGNNWFISSATNNTPGGQNSLYISNDNGNSNQYNIALSSIVWAYKDFYFTPSTNEYTITFDWKCMGQIQGTTKYDYFSLYIGNLTTPIASANSFTLPTGALLLGSFNQQDDWITENVVIPNSACSGQTKRLYFCWRNNESYGTQPPIAIDNIYITSSGIINCISPSNLAVSNVTHNNAIIQWSSGGAENEWEVDFKELTSSTWTTISVVNSLQLSLSNLAPLTTYQVRVRAKCLSNLFSNYTTVVPFVTPIEPNTFYITATSNEFGEISPNGTIAVDSGANQSFLFIPHTNCLLSYLWIDNIPELLPGATYTFFQVSENHSIHADFVTVDVNDFKNNSKIEIYPNPANTFITLKVLNENLNISTATIFDIYGNLLKTIQINNQITLIDIIDLAPGLYIIRINSKINYQNFKLIKK